MTKNKNNTPLNPFANKLSGDCRQFRGGPVRGNAGTKSAIS